SVNERIQFLKKAATVKSRLEQVLGRPLSPAKEEREYLYWLTSKEPSIIAQYLERLTFYKSREGIASMFGLENAPIADRTSPFFLLADSFAKLDLQLADEAKTPGKTSKLLFDNDFIQVQMTPRELLARMK